jgi:hypothetical protein
MSGSHSNTAFLDGLFDKGFLIQKFNEIKRLGYIGSTALGK